ncbi:ras-interacting protein 1-like, partial [Onychostruthus taczanowskii]|uniref:ras-interacting protein 1-like n=1 Tax=Onychostruthus taczanowskii TaxID=356909 RepID=UPI001B80984D
PPKAKPPRHKRLSHLFHRTSAPSAASTAARWASEKKLAELRGSGGAEPPSILKVFGGALSSGANYKSVLATARCSARQLLRQALERYGLRADECARFALCDVLGRAPPAGAGPAGGGAAWQGEHVRLLGDRERPLLLQ